jgi:hypothetical protein
MGDHIYKNTNIDLYVELIGNYKYICNQMYFYDFIVSVYFFSFKCKALEKNYKNEKSLLTIEIHMIS